MEKRDIKSGALLFFPNKDEQKLKKLEKEINILKEKIKKIEERIGGINVDFQNRK